MQNTYNNVVLASNTLAKNNTNNVVLASAAVANNNTNNVVLASNTITNNDNVLATNPILYGVCEKLKMQYAYNDNITKYTIYSDYFPNNMRLTSTECNELLKYLQSLNRGYHLDIGDYGMTLHSTSKGKLIASLYLIRW